MLENLEKLFKIQNNARKSRNMLQNLERAKNQEEFHKIQKVVTEARKSRKM